MKLFVFVLFYLSHSFASESFYIKGYQNNSIDIKILGYGDRKNNEYLIQVTGYDHESSGEVFLYKKIETNPSLGLFKLCMKNHKTYKNWCAFHIENGGWGSKITRVFPPGINKSEIVYPMKKEDSKKIDRGLLIKQFQRKGKVL